MSDVVSLEPEIHARLQELRLQAEKRVRDLREQLDEAEHVHEVLAVLATYETRKWWLHLLNRLPGHDSPAVLIQDTETTPIGPVLDALREKASAYANDVHRDFPRLFEKACEEARITIDPESRHPRYSLDRQFFQLHFLPKTRTVRLSDVEGRLEETPADVDAVIEVIQREQRRLFERPFNGEAFIRKLYRQYIAVLSKGETEWSDGSVPIRAITKRLGKNEKGFRTDEFIVDLDRLVRQGPLAIDGKRLDLQQTREVSQGVLLRDSADRGYVGFVIFREEMS